MDRTRFVKPFAVALLSTTIVGSPVFAQTEAQDPKTSAPAAAPQEQNHDIIVTATRRETRVQDTPLSITAVGGEALQNAGVTSSAGLAKVAPNLVIRDNSTGVGSRLIIRNIYAVGEPIVGLYYDDTPVVSTTGTAGDAGSTTPSVRLFDIDHVEVLRGPQGTLFGASSMAGNVRLIYAKPDLENFGGAFDGSVSGVAHGGAGWESNVMANVPIVKGILGVRAVGYYTDTPRYVDNPVLGRKDINGAKGRGGRVIVRLKPASNLTLDVTGIYQKTTGEKGTWNYITGNERTPDYEAPIQTRQPQSDELSLVSGNASWDAGFATVTGNVSYEHRRSFYTLDVSQFFTDFGAILPEEASKAPSVSYVPSLTRNYTQELRASSNGHGWFGWTVGFYHSLRHGTIFSNVVTADPATGIMRSPLTFTDYTVNGVTVPANTIYRRSIDEQLEQTAGYGEISVRPLEGLTLTAGTRYYDYKQRVASQVLIGEELLGSAGPLNRSRNHDSGWIGKFNASYKVAPDVMVYAQAAQGFRPGGVNQVVGLPAAVAPYKPDSLWDYEIGVKSTFFDRMLTLNADIFQIDWSNIQVQGVTPNGASNFISNAGAARARGFEVEATIRPIRGLTLQANGSYTDAKLTQDQISDIIVAPGRKGDRIQYTPTWTFQGSAQYDRPLSGTLSGMARLDVNYNSASYTVLEVTKPLNQRMPGFATVDGRIGIESEDSGWGAYLFMNNMFDKLGINYEETLILYGRTEHDRVSSIAPRTIGLEVRKKF